MNWKINPDYTGRTIKINWVQLANKMSITLQQLNEEWNNGIIFVFDGLDAICEFYLECGLDTPSTELLKADLDEGTVIYTQHLFFMIA